MSNNIELKGSSFTLSVIHLHDNDLDKAIQILNHKVQQAPSFFSSAPVVINISKIKQSVDFNLLKKEIFSTGLVPDGITGCSQPELLENARQSGFAIMNAGRQIVNQYDEKPHQENFQTKTEAETNNKEQSKTKIIKTPVRSGQQIYAQDCDLVVMNNVSAGAEIISDGNIHIYGTLRGRAIAGAKGNQESIIFCNNLKPELISIAGNYWLSENIAKDYWGQPSLTTLQNNNLNIQLLV